MVYLIPVFLFCSNEGNLYCKGSSPCWSDAIYQHTSFPSSYTRPHTELHSHHSTHNESINSIPLVMNNCSKFISLVFDSLNIWPLRNISLSLEAASVPLHLSHSLTHPHTDLKTKHKDKQVMVLGETCHAEKLDWDLRGSFDMEVFMSIPTEAARAKILQVRKGRTL